MSFVSVKLEYSGSLRLLRMPSEYNFVETRSKIERLMPLNGRAILKFCDLDGDIVTIGSDNELSLAYSEALSVSKVPRLIVEREEPRVQSADEEEDVPTESSASLANEGLPQDANAMFLFVLRTLIVEQNKKNNKWRPNGPRGCRGSGKNKSGNNVGGGKKE